MRWGVDTRVGGVQLIIVVRVVKGVEGLPRNLETLFDGVFVSLRPTRTLRHKAALVIQGATRRAGAGGRGTEIKKKTVASCTTYQLVDPESRRNLRCCQVVGIRRSR